MTTWQTAISKTAVDFQAPKAIHCVLFTALTHILSDFEH